MNLFVCPSVRLRMSVWLLRAFSSSEHLADREAILNFTIDYLYSDVQVVIKKIRFSHNMNQNFTISNKYETFILFVIAILLDFYLLIQDINFRLRCLRG